jgi:SAM-dependent methyltransferase
LCGGSLHKVFELKDSPIANSYPLKPDPDGERFPMQLMACDECGHVQQRHVLNGLFTDYKYQTPQTVASYLEPVAKRIADKHPGARVLEIGCNNGVFLDCLIAEGLDAWGVDPANSHVRGLTAPFTSGLAETLGKFDVVVGNNVFAHIDNLRDVFAGIVKVLEPDGALIFEVQYLVDLVESGSFDMIYHEHLDYHHLAPLKPFLRSFGLVMTDWEHIKNHGGSIRVTARKFGEECEIPEEKIDWKGLKGRIEAARTRCKAVLGSHGKVVCFGAAAKATTLINEFGIEDRILYCVDDTPQKQFRYIPGTKIQILPTSALKPDQAVLLTAWNYASEIGAKYPNQLINPFR